MLCGPPPTPNCFEPMINFGIRQDTILDFLRGNVESAATEEYEIVDSQIGRIKDRSLRNYDSDGNRLSAEYYDAASELRLRQVSKIDSYGRKTEYANYDVHDRHTGGGQYIYDESGHIYAKIHDGEVEEQYVTDGNGRILQVIYPNTGARSIYQYDDRGFVETQIDIPMDTSNLSQFEQMMMGSLFGKNTKQIFKFVNDDHGNIIEQKLYEYDTNELKFKILWIVNPEGDVVEETTYQGGKVINSLNYRYRYDSRGNWIERIKYGTAGQVRGLRRRKITYHDS